MFNARKQQTAVTVVLLVALASCGIGSVYTGSLSTDGGADGLLSGVGQSWGTGSTLSWIVDTEAVGGVSYQYTLTVDNVPAAGISHFSLEVSDAFEAADVLSDDWAGSLLVGLMSPDPGSPSLPSAFRAIKFDDNPNGKTVTVSLLSTRLPVWGDFYAKGGDSNELWNAGFGVDDSVLPYLDPTDPPANGSIRDHLLVPDTDFDIGRVLRVFKYWDNDGDGENDADLADRVQGWSISLDGAAPQLTDGAGMVMFPGLTGDHSITESPDNLFTGALVFDASNGNLLSTIADPDAIDVLMDRNLDIFIGNVPEPATFALLGLGAVGLMLRRFRRR